MRQRQAPEAVGPVGRSQDTLHQCGLARSARQLLHPEVLKGGKDLGVGEQGVQLLPCVAGDREEARLLRMQGELCSRSEGDRGFPHLDSNARALRGIAPVPGGEIIDILPGIRRPRPLHSNLPGPGKNSQS